jgi:hypothetical protein
MARTAITPLPLTRNGGEAETTVNIDQANGMTIANANPERTILRIANTGTLGNAIVRAGSSIYPALLKGQGDVTTSVAATTGVSYMGPFDSARVLQPDGSMSIDFASGVAGKITAIVRQ